mmetsp:Transcript_107082/g.194925  ORF Transcript_107082/g.194925 Transcript_107082/m.194925 type:complete len:135 (-) Transcript_107082:87-491(-)
MTRAALCIASLFLVAQYVAAAKNFLQAAHPSVHIDLGQQADAATKSNSSAKQSPEEVQYLIDTFYETGCPNPHPSDGQLSWWHDQPQEKVLRDMYLICKRNEDGHPNAAQRQECCGEEDCSHIGCVQQDAYTVN